MTIKDISILKSLDPITVLDDPNPKTIEYLAKLLQEPKFNEFLDVLHAQGNVPPGGISINAFLGQNFSDLPPIRNELIRSTLESTSHQLCQSIGLSDDFIIPLLLLIFFNAFIDVDYFEGFITAPIQFILGRKQIASSMFDYPHEVGAIVIPFNMSQRTLVKWIESKENWESIQKQMDENLTPDPYLLRLHINTEIAVEIVELKDRQGKSYKEVADYLSEKYPDNNRVKDSEWVKKIYRDYKEMWNSLTKETNNK